MAIAQRTVGRPARTSGLFVGLRFPVTMASRSVSTLGRLIFGGDAGVRSYPRERFSDYELHQLVAGRKDRLDRPF